MKNLVVLLFVLTSVFINAQDAEYTLSSYLSEGFKAPNTHHIGDAWLNFLVQADEDFDQNITQATFSANSTLDWHKHSTTQIIIVVDGKGYYQERGKTPMIMKKGDVIKCAKDTEHWHTSSAESSVSYIAVYGKAPTIWTEKLTQEYYDSVAKTLKGQ
ncbi:MAG: cupin domain-containing protein [Flavobacteriaceae bacterium]|nr:cupin domain-containing protein [Flavobacteriaceae bacterium]NNL61646.1 cupin domain-containing protein [Flavobacteriaceae bacterium]RZV64277.1 MAG: cupin domain-containing protein [Flavobacteriaceae bacterium]